MKEEAENKDILEIKALWEQLNERMERLELTTVEESRRVAEMRIKSAQEDLIRRYRRFSIIACIFAVVTPIVYGNPYQSLFHYPSKLYSIIVGASMFIYFAVCGVMDFYLSNAVKDINLAKMPVIEVRRQAINLKRLHHIFQIILIPMAIALLILISYPIMAQVWIGVIFGAIVGLAIGINAYMKMMADYKEMINS